MIIALGLLVFLRSCNPCPAAAPVDGTGAIADAIERHENSTAFPYGIKDGHRHSLAEARQICINTIRNAWSDWLHYGGSASDMAGFIDYLGDIYCPKSDDAQGNVNWKHNVKFFLGIKR